MKPVKFNCERFFSKQSDPNSMEKPTFLLIERGCQKNLNEKGRLENICDRPPLPQKLRNFSFLSRLFSRAMSFCLHLNFSSENVLIVMKPWQFVARSFCYNTAQFSYLGPVTYQKVGLYWMWSRIPFRAGRPDSFMRVCGEGVHRTGAYWFCQLQFVKVARMFD